MSEPVEFRSRKLLDMQERRPDVIANSASHTSRPIRYADLTSGQQDLFEKQLNAYRAAVVLARAADEAAFGGWTVHPDLVKAWLAARNTWNWMRGIE